MFNLPINGLPGSVSGGLRKAIVVDTHPEDNSVDVVMCDDGARLAGVPVLCGTGSARSGGVDLPEVPNKSGADKWNITQRNGQDMEAVIGSMGRGNPVVLGFLFPQVSQMTFKDKKRRFNRHQSDVYQTIDGEGNAEFYHPSGAYVRIAEKTEHEDLEKKNFDKSMELDRNKDKKIKIHVQTKDGKSSVTLGEDGTITIKAAKKIVCEAPLLEVPSGDVIASGVSLRDHIHRGVKSGPDVSGVPVRSSFSNQSGQDPSGGNAGTNPGTESDNATAITRMKYGEPPEFNPVGQYNRTNFTLPSDKSAISEDLFYERFRTTAIASIDGLQQTVISEFDKITGKFTQHLVGRDLIGMFNGMIPDGMLNSPVGISAFKVFADEVGQLYAEYTESGGTYAFDAMHNGMYIGRGAANFGVLYKISQEEFDQHGTPAS